jgi:hypothetical protein
MIRSSRRRGVGQVARIGEVRKGCKPCSENLKGRSNLEYLGVYGRIILKWILNPEGRWTVFIWIKKGTGGEVCTSENYVQKWINKHFNY